MRHVYHSLLGLVLLLVLSAGNVAAQTSVTGTVTDAATGDPLPGVSIVVKGTTVGTTTNIDGEYELELPPNRRTLVFSFVGFKSQEQAVPEGANMLDVALDEDVLGLEEVVVTGFWPRPSSVPTWPTP